MEVERDVLYGVVEGRAPLLRSEETEEADRALDVQRSETSEETDGDGPYCGCCCSHCLYCSVGEGEEEVSALDGLTDSKYGEIVVLL